MTPPSPAFGLSKIGQIAINVHDLDRATAFYRDVLGIPFLFSAPGMAFFNCDGVRLLLSLPETEALDHPASIIYYQVEDIASAHQILSARGVVFEGEPHVVHRTEHYELWMAAFHDPDQNLLAMMSEVHFARA